MASNTYNLNTWRAKRIIGDTAAGNLSNALLQLKANDTWILLMDRNNVYGIMYSYDGTNGHDKVQYYGGSSDTPTAWIQLDTGDIYVLGKVGIGYDPSTNGNTYKLYVDGGTSYFDDNVYLNSKLGVGYNPDSNGNTYKLYVDGGTSYFDDNFYLNGQLGIGYNPDTNGNTYKLYVNGTSYFNGQIEGVGGIILPWIELSSATPYIDWHFGSSTADYTSRIIESSSGYLEVNAKLGINGSNTSYNFYVNGTSYLNGNTVHNGIIYFGNDTTYYISADGTQYTGSAAKWTTARTFTIGETGKSVNGTADVSWSMNDIMGSSDSTKFYRGDKTWSNVLTGGISVRVNGEGYVLVSDGTHYSDDTFRVVLDLNPTSGNHGIYSSGYLNGTTFTSNGKWLLVRDNTGAVQMNGNASTASKWETKRTLTIGGTGKDVDGSAAVSWSMNEIMGSSDSTKFYRGDKTWSNTLTGDLTVQGVLYASSGSSLKGVKVGDNYMNAINASVIFQNCSEIRFGTNAWDWNCWAGMRYDNADKHLYIGMAHSPLVKNSEQWGYITLAGIRELYFQNGGATNWNGIRATVADNDYWRIGGAGTASNSGYMEIATADDGNEPIYVRQYTGVFSTLKRTLTLLDGSGNTTLPGEISIGSRGTTSGPSSITYSNRITIVPYFHTGGPWYIKSGDNASNAYLALYYSSSNLIRTQHNGNIEITGPATDSVGAIHVVDTRTDAGWHYPFLGTCASLAANGNMYLCIGKAASTGNAAGLRYQWAGASSNSNLMGFEFYGQGTKLWVYANGNGGVSAEWSAGTHIKANNGYLYSTANGNTVTIGSQNTGWCHIQNSADRPFYFNKQVTVDGHLLPYTNNTRNLGDSSHKWTVCYATNFYGYLNGSISGSSTSCTGNAATATNSSQLGGVAASGYLRTWIAGTTGNNSVIVTHNSTGSDSSRGQCTAFGNGNGTPWFTEIQYGATYARTVRLGSGMGSTAFISATQFAIISTSWDQVTVMQNSGSTGAITSVATGGANYSANGSNYRAWMVGDSVTGAVWNDYAENRETINAIPGQCVYEVGDDTLMPTEERLQHFAGIVSDTWGFSQGETETAKTPIAVAGRVLAYTYRSRNEYKPGDVLCAAPGGTVDLMSREEVQMYPDRIVGTVSCIPEYETWGGGENSDRKPIEVDGRIWVKVK